GMGKLLHCITSLVLAQVKVVLNHHQLLLLRVEEPLHLRKRQRAQVDVYGYHLPDRKIGSGSFAGTPAEGLSQPW
ncbi:hypothetical protein P4O66_012457, partial [Electrophorus voltai]